jgi:gamma-glutamyltranspeptidase
VLSLEAGFSPTVQQELISMGYVLQPIDHVGRVEVILERGGVLEGAYDKREGGKVASY